MKERRGEGEKERRGERERKEKQTRYEKWKKTHKIPQGSWVDSKRNRWFEEFFFILIVYISIYNMLTDQWFAGYAE